MYNVCFKSVQHSILCHLKTNDFVRDIHFFRHFSLETGLLPCFAIFFFHTDALVVNVQDR